MKDPLSKWEDRAKEQPERETLASRLFHQFMIALCLGIVFLISGGLAVLWVGREFPDTTPTAGAGVFGAGGVAGVGILLYFYHRDWPRLPK